MSNEIEPTPEELSAARSEPVQEERRITKQEPVRLHKTPEELRRTYSPDPYRLLPQSPDAEKGTLCSCMISPKDIIGLCVEKGIAKDSFAIPSHGVIYEHLLKMWESNTAIDLITVTQYLRDRGHLDSCGGVSFISSVFTFLPTAANAPFYIESMQEKGVLRGIIKIGTEFVGRAYDEQHEVHGLLDKFEAEVLKIRSVRRTTKPSIQSIVVEVISDIQTRYDSKGTVGGLTTGFSELDKQIDGMHPEEMIVLAARPSHGKSAFAMNIVEHISLDLGKASLAFSLEMSSKQLVQRMLCSRARVNYFRIRDGFLSERDFPAMQVAASEIANSNIIIEDQAGLSIQEIMAISRRVKSEKNIEFIMLDYLQIARSSTKRAQENREREIAEVSEGSKRIAKELGIPVLVLAQVGRAADKEKRRPRLSDLRESGAIEQDADKVLFLSREEMYAETQEEIDECEGQANIHVAKQRSGPLGDIPLTFLKEFCRFETRAREWQEEDKQQVLIK